jgi:hypothetical protein
MARSGRETSRGGEGEGSLKREPEEDDRVIHVGYKPSDRQWRWIELRMERKSKELTLAETTLRLKSRIKYGQLEFLGLRHGGHLFMHGHEY